MQSDNDAGRELPQHRTEADQANGRSATSCNGDPAAGSTSGADPAGIAETLDIVGTPGAVEAIREGQADGEAGRYADSTELKARYGLA